MQPPITMIPIRLPFIPRASRSVQEPGLAVPLMPPRALCFIAFAVLVWTAGLLLLLALRRTRDGGTQRPLNRHAFVPCLGPRDRKVADLSALPCLRNEAEALENDPALELAVKRDAEVMAHHEGQEDRARGPGVLGHVSGHRG